MAFGNKFADYFGGQGNIRNDLVNRGNLRQPGALDSMMQNWNSASAQGGGAPQNPYSLYYRGGQNAFKNEAPKMAAQEGMEWASQARTQGMGGPKMYGWYQRKIGDPAAGGQPGVPAGPQTPDQNLANAVNGNPMHAQSGAGAAGGAAGGLGGLLGDAIGQGWPGQLPGGQNGGGGLLGAMGNRPGMQQFANPYSPYNFMPMMPSSPMDPSMTSKIGGQDVTHNIPLLSNMYQTNMNQPTQQTPTLPGAGVNYDYRGTPNIQADQQGAQLQALQRQMANMQQGNGGAANANTGIYSNLTNLRGF